MKPTKEPIAISPEQERRVLEVLHNDHKYKKLEAARQEYLRRHLWAQAMQTARTMKRVEKAVFDELLSRQVEEKVSVASLMDSFTPEERTRIETCLHGVVFCCDVIDSLMRDTTEIISRKHPGSRIETYERLKKLSEAAREQMRLATEGTTYAIQENYADYAQAVEDFVLKKVAVFLRKQQRIVSRENKLKRQAT